jgi:hypothetical protein
MIRLIHKIPAFVLACLLGLNLAAAGAVVAEPCPPSLCPGGLMDMGHHNGMIDFTLPMSGCGEDCKDIFCDLLKDPLPEANAVNSSPLPGPYYPVILGTADALGPFGLRADRSESRHLLSPCGSSSQIPLYLEHLSLII